MILGLLILLIGGIFVFNKITVPEKKDLPIQEVDLGFDAEGPYAVLTPRSDGNALILNVTRVSSYPSISYELAYQSTGNGGAEGEGVTSIDRGVTGVIDTKNKKSDYSQEILFGTCSQGYTSGEAHCVFDKGVENGTLTLRIEKETKRGDKFRTVYKMITTWHLQKPDVALGKLSSGDEHFKYETTASREELASVGYSIINDLSGSPKLPEGKAVLGKIYGLSVPNTRAMPKGQVSIELAENPSQEAKIYRYIESKNEWETLDTKISGSSLSANSSANGIFAVLASKK